MGGLFLNIFVILCKEEKCEENWAIFRNIYLKEVLKQFSSILICEVAYMLSRKYTNLGEIGSVVLEIQKVEFGNFKVPLNDTLVCLASSFVFLATDTLATVCVDQFITHH